MRFDKPVGIYLLLSPALWGLLLATHGKPSINLVLIFFIGTIVMRAAGCAANDLIDRDLDGYVERTRFRPLVTGVITPKEARYLIFFLFLLALFLVAQTNFLTFLLAIAGALLTLIYPLMKRVTHLPQVVLGLAFSWSIPMAFAASTETLPTGLWWLFAANCLWTIAYDTQYAMVDREDDLAVGIKSTAILFGDKDRLIIALLLTCCALCFIICGLVFHLGPIYFTSIIAVIGLFIRHLWLIRDRSKTNCFKAFNEAKWVGLIILFGLLGHFVTGYTQSINLSSHL